MMIFEKKPESIIIRPNIFILDVSCAIASRKKMPVTKGRYSSTRPMRFINSFCYPYGTWMRIPEILNHPDM